MEKDGTEHVSQDDKGELELMRTLQLFFSGDVEAGESLLALSGNAAFSIEAVKTVIFDVLKLQLNSTIAELVGLSCGIIANLALSERLLNVAASNLDLGKVLIEVCQTNDDPLVITEALRAMTNIVHGKRATLLHVHYADLASFSLYLSENSLSSELLAQLMQLVYYVHVYSSEEEVLVWHDTWDALRFFSPIMCVTDDVDSNVVVPLKSVTLAERSGLEWMLLCLDHITGQVVDQPSVGRLLQADWLLTTLLSLLLQTNEVGWDDKPRRDLLPPIVLSPAEKFLLVSVLENLVAYWMEKHVERFAQHLWWSLSWVVQEVDMKAGWVKLLGALLETCEDAVMMRDSYGVNAVVYIICVLMGDYGTGNGATSTSEQDSGNAAHIGGLISQGVGAALTVQAAIRDVAELVANPEHVTWTSRLTSGEYKMVDMLDTLGTAVNADITHTRLVGNIGEEHEKRARLALQCIADSIQALSAATESKS